MNPKDKMGAQKPNLSVLPFAPLLEVIPALYEGRRKYGPWNWRAEKVSETIYADAAIRHLMQFLAGEDVDQDSGVHHIAKAIAGLLVVRDAQLHDCSIDDRMVSQNLGIAKIMGQLAGVNERYPEPVESALPPRRQSVPLPRCNPEHVCPSHEDQGITGGETMTEEDAEKVAEYLGLRDARLSRWSSTPSGGGCYRIKESDVGKMVELRDGTISTIRGFGKHTGWPIRLSFRLTNVACTTYGEYSSEQRDENGFSGKCPDPRDIVKVFHL